MDVNLIYGTHFWTVELEGGDRVGCYADEVDVRDGALVLLSHGVIDKADRDSSPLIPYLIFPAGRWMLVAAVSVVDGRKLAVERWEERFPF